MGVGRFAPSSGTVQKAVSGPGVPGRPVKIGSLSLLPPNAAHGEWFNLKVSPASLQQAEQKYLRSHQLPPGLAPRSKTYQGMTNRQISRGFTKPSRLKGSDG